MRRKKLIIIRSQLEAYDASPPTMRLGNWQIHDASRYLSKPKINVVFTFDPNVEIEGQPPKLVKVEFRGVK